MDLTMRLKRTYAYLLCLFLTTAVFFTVVGLVSWLNIREGTIKQAAYLETHPLQNNTPDLDWNGIEVVANITTIDIHHSSVYVHFKFTPYGETIEKDKNRHVRTLAHPLEVAMDGKVVFFEPGQSMANIEHHFAFFDNQINLYPFDSYKGNLMISAYQIRNPTDSISNNINNNTSNSTIISPNNSLPKRIPIPLSVHISGALQGYHFDLSYGNPRDKDSSTTVDIIIFVKRSIIWIGFAIFIQVLMWILSGSLALMILSVFKTRKKVLPPVLGLCTAMLFALPSLRNQQPGSPPIGILADVVGFFWNMVIVGISTLLVISKFIYDQYHEEQILPKENPIVGNKIDTILDKQSRRQQHRTAKDEMHMIDPMMIDTEMFVQVY